MTEYVRFMHPTVIYAKKQLLQSQLESLSIMQRMKRYHELRDQEFLLKIDLKKKLDEVKADLAIFEKLLPKSQRKEDNTEFELPVEKQIRRSELEEEINLIRAKLAQLQ